MTSVALVRSRRFVDQKKIAGTNACRSAVWSPDQLNLNPDVVRMLLSGFSQLMRSLTRSPVWLLCSVKITDARLLFSIFDG